MQTARILWSKAMWEETYLALEGMADLLWNTTNQYALNSSISPNRVGERVTARESGCRKTSENTGSFKSCSPMNSFCISHMLPSVSHQQNMYISVLLHKGPKLSSGRQVWLILGDLPYFSHRESCWPWENHNFSVSHLQRRNKSDLTHSVVWERKSTKNKEL